MTRDVACLRDMVRGNTVLFHLFTHAEGWQQLLNRGIPHWETELCHDPPLTLGLAQRDIHWSHCYLYCNDTILNYENWHRLKCMVDTVCPNFPVTFSQQIAEVMHVWAWIGLGCEIRCRKYNKVVLACLNRECYSHQPKPETKCPCVVIVEILRKFQVLEEILN